jgi:serine protease Do
MNSGFRRLLALAAVFIIAFSAVSALRVWRAGGDYRDLVPAFFQRKGEFRPETFTLPEKAPLTLDDVELLSRLNDEYARLTDAVVPSVVSINTAGIRTERLQDIYGRTQLRNSPTQGEGSGIIVTKEGHVITNHHVIAGQQKIQITLHGGKTFPATLIGEDQLLDIAVLKINATEEFVPLKLGDSSQVRVGQMVFAVGNPFGLGETVTQGIISAKERSLSDNQRDLFQTDAAINPGNSGGPLVNLRGEIIGINVAILSKDRENPGFQGVGFSIPSNDVKDALFQILERGRPVRGFLGVQMRDLDPAMRSAIHFTGENGVGILGILPNSPAENAGLLPWDVILTYNGEKVSSSSQLITLVQRSPVGKDATIEVWRKGEMLELKTRIRESGTAETTAKRTPSNPSKSLNSDEVLNAIGLEVRDLSAPEALHGFRGVVATRVTESAIVAGKVLPGDLIVAVNNTQISNTNEFYLHLAASASVQATTLQIIRHGESQRIDIPDLPRGE